MKSYYANIYHYDADTDKEPIKWSTEYYFDTDGNPYDEVDKYTRDNDAAFGHLALEVDVYSIDGKKEYVKRY